MAKIAIDDKEYDTETFTEEQTVLFNRVSLGLRLLEEAEHTAGSLRLAQQALTTELKTSLEKENDKDE